MDTGESEETPMSSERYHNPRNQSKRLRGYQIEAVERTSQWLRDGKGRAPVIVLPTGSGKSLVLGEIAKRAARRGHRPLIIAHRRELLRQNRDQLLDVAPELFGRVGIFSAGLREKDLRKPITIAGIQSLANARSLPRFNPILIDEAHRVPPINEVVFSNRVQQYSDTINRLNGEHDTKPFYVGLTATPYRHGQGWIHRMRGSLWDGIAYEAPMGRLVRDGYLSPLVTATGEQMDESRLKVGGGGDFTSTSQETALGGLLETIVDGAIEQMKREVRRSGMIFTPSIQITEDVTRLLRRRGESAVSVTSDNPSPERDNALRAFKRREARWIVSCGILTEGFDAPHVDLIVMARATNSAALWVQIAGRGSRLCAGKTNCAIRDHGRNVERHGPVDAVTPKIYARSEKRREEKERKGKGAADTDVKKLRRLTLDPSKNRMIVDGGGGNEHWQRVTRVECRRKLSQAGNDMAVVTFRLEGMPDHVRLYIVLAHLKRNRSFMSRRFSRIVGQPPAKGANADEHYAVLKAGVRRIESVVVGIDDSGRPCVGNIERP